MFDIPDHNKAQNAVLQIVTAARAGDFNLAATIAGEFELTNGTILPLLISSVSLIESILRTVAEEMELPPDKLFAGICLGLSVKQIEEQQREEGTS